MQNALNPSQQDPVFIGDWLIVPADNDGLGRANHVPERRQPLLTQRPSRRDNIGDDVSYPEANRNLDCPIQPNHVGLDAPLRKISTDEMRVTRRDALSFNLIEIPFLILGSRIAEGRRTETESEEFIHSIRGRICS